MNPATDRTEPECIDQVMYINMIGEKHSDEDLQQVRIGQCEALEQALQLASEAVATQSRDEAIVPAMVSIVDNLGRLVAVGEIINSTSVEWIPPYSSEYVIQVSQARIEQMLAQACCEATHNNFTTARGLRRNAKLMEGRAPHPVWRATVINVLSALQSIETLH